MPAQLYIEQELFVRNEFWETPDLENFTVVQLGMLADMQKLSDEEYWIDQEYRQKAQELAREALIDKTIAMGAGDRETAERWLKDADDQYLEFDFRSFSDYAA